MSTIEVIGRGKVKLKPDIIIFRMSFNITDENYETVVNKEVETINEFFDILESMGVKKEEFITTSYSIEHCYKTREKEYYEETDEKVLVGYTAKRSGHFTIPLDFKALQNFVYKFENLNAKSSYDFSSSDRSEAKKEAMKLAYEDAYQKAKLFADVSGKELVGFNKLLYEESYGGGYSLSPINYSRRMPLSDTFNVGDLVIYESVKIIWNVK